MGIDKGIKGEVKTVMPAVYGSSVMNAAMIKKNGNNPIQTIVQMMALIKIIDFFSINDILLIPLINFLTLSLNGNFQKVYTNYFELLEWKLSEGHSEAVKKLSCCEKIEKS